MAQRSMSQVRSMAAQRMAKTNLLQAHSMSVRQMVHLERRLELSQASFTIGKNGDEIKRGVSLGMSRSREIRSCDLQ
jgi:hypothetical protein